MLLNEVYRVCKVFTKVVDVIPGRVLRSRGVGWLSQDGDHHLVVDDL